MQSVLITLFILLVAFIGTELIFGKLLGASRMLRITGTNVIFICLGILIGPAGIDFINEQVVAQLKPFIFFGLGWIGFLYGIQFERRQMLRFDTHRYIFIYGQALITVLIVGVGIILISKMVFASYTGIIDLLFFSAILALTAAGASPSTIFLLTRELKIRSRQNNIIQMTASLDDLPSVVGIGILLALGHSYLFGDSIITKGSLWILVSIIIGVALGLLLKILAGLWKEEEIYTLLTIGLVALSSGLAMKLHLSAVFINFVLGATFANISDNIDIFFRGLIKREHTIYILFLILIGALWHLHYGNLAIMLPAYIILRILGKVAGSYLLVKTVIPYREEEPISPWLGLSLLSQGGVALALIVDYFLVFPSALTDCAMTLVILSVIISEIISLPAYLSMSKRFIKS